MKNTNHKTPDSVTPTLLHANKLISVERTADGVIQSVTTQVEVGKTVTCRRNRLYIAGANKGLINLTKAVRKLHAGIKLGVGQLAALQLFATQQQEAI